MTCQKPKILLIDDRSDNLFSLSGILSEIDCEIITAKSGAEAIKLASDNEFACLLLDIQMPDMDGFEVAEKLKGKNDIQDTPIIFVSAFEITTESIRKGYALGALDYLTKPLSPDLIRTKVSLYCELYQMRKLLNQPKGKRK